MFFKLVVAVTVILAWLLIGCDLRMLGNKTEYEESTVVNASISNWYFVQEGDSMTWHPMTSALDLKPDVPFEVHWTASGNAGTVKLLIVHEQCGNVIECGKDFPSCPHALMETKGGSIQLGALVSGLPGAREYQITINYQAEGGSCTHCRRIDLTPYPDTTGDLSSIHITPL